MHQPRKRLIFEHRIATDIAMKDQIYRAGIVMLLHIVRIHKLPRDFKEDTRRIAVWTPRTEGRCPLWDVNLLFRNFFLEGFFAHQVPQISERVMSFRITSEAVFEKWDKLLNENRCIQSGGRGNAY